MPEQETTPKFSPLVTGIALLTIPGLANGLYNPTLHNSSLAAFWALDFIQYWALPIAVLLTLYLKYDVRPKDYGLISPGRNYPLWEMSVAALIIALVLVAAWYLLWVPGRILFGADDYLFSFDLVIPDGTLRIPVILYLSVSAGVIEEITFRGLTWTAFAKLEAGKYRNHVYLITSSLLFASVHWEQGLAGLLGSFGFGLVAAAFYLQLKNLWPLVGAHTLANLYFFS